MMRFLSGSVPSGSVPSAFVLSVALLFATVPQRARAATDIDLFFPVPVQGKLAVEMQRLIERFDQEHPDIHVTAVYTGSYDDTNVKNACRDPGRPASGRRHHERQFRARIRHQRRGHRVR
jgi:hypothetical protein